MTISRVFAILTFSALCLAAVGCVESGQPSASNQNVESNSKPVRPPRVCEPTTDTPTAAYKRLFAAVKSKDTEQIKAGMSKATQEMAQMLAGRQNNPIEKVYENGFTATTFAAALPEMRDERIKGCWAALEVRNTKENRWEDLGFVNEEGKWKFAFGDFFSGEYESPGKGTDEKLKEAANTASGNRAVPAYPTANVNTSNVNMRTPVPYNGPQVDTLPKNK